MSNKIETANSLMSSDLNTLLSPETEAKLKRFDKSVDKVNATINNANELTKNVQTLWNCTLETVKTVKELDVLMKNMDVSLERYLQDTNVSLEKFRISAPIVEKQLDRISDRMDNILNSALEINPKTCELKELELRGNLIKQVRDWSDQISTLLIKLMGI